MKKFFNKNNKGFTLVELIVVIAVISIITVVVAPKFLEYVEKSRIGTDKNAVGEVCHAAEVVYVKEKQSINEWPFTFKIKIHEDGTSEYGGAISDFINGVKEIVPPEAYIYKSKAYRGHTVVIAIGEDGVAGMQNEPVENKIWADYFGIEDPETIETIEGILNMFFGENAVDKFNDLLFEMETNGEAFDSMTRDEKADKLNEEVPGLGTALKPLLPRDCGCSTCPLYCDCEGCPDKTTGGSGGGSTGCVATGSLVTLADGSVKKVEELLLTDKVLAFDHETGKYVATDILVVANHGDKFRHVMNLEFSNGSAVKLIDYHGLFDITLNKYVYLTNDNFVEYKGHEFAMQSENGYETAVLENAFLSYEFTGAYAVVTDYHMNCFTNGFFSIIPEAKIAVDAFEYDRDLKYNAEKMLQDIETYGLFEYEEFASFVSEEVFNLMPFKYVKVTAGKGLTTMEEVAEILNGMSDYLSVFGEEATYIKDMK